MAAIANKFTARGCKFFAAEPTNTQSKEPIANLVRYWKEAAMLNCKQATELMSQERDRSLIFRERLGLRFHVAVCPGCRNFRTQMALLHEACTRYPEAGTEEEDKRDPV